MKFKILYCQYFIWIRNNNIDTILNYFCRAFTLFLAYTLNFKKYVLDKLMNN